MPFSEPTEIIQKPRSFFIYISIISTGWSEIWILGRRDFGLAAAIVGVADLAFLPIDIPPGRNIGGIGKCAQRVREIPLAGGHRPIQKPLSDDTFEPRRIAAGARALPHDEGVSRPQKDEQGAQRNEATPQSSIYGH